MWTCTLENVGFLDLDWYFPSCSLYRFVCSGIFIGMTAQCTPRPNPRKCGGAPHPLYTPGLWARGAASAAAGRHSPAAVGPGPGPWGLGDGWRKFTCSAISDSALATSTPETGPPSPMSASLENLVQNKLIDGFELILLDPTGFEWILLDFRGTCQVGGRGRRYPSPGRGPLKVHSEQFKSIQDDTDQL